MESKPWVEKYRPSKLNEVVLDINNRKILENIIKTEHFPNLLFYGPPGTGKTTTIINLINSYQEKKDEKHKGLMIHLNASDERGIDIVRNQIASFVNSMGLFNKGMKFVVLDEVDYMTKNAQQALKYLLQNYSENVRYCLICNYISRIDESLQNEFIRLRFNQLPVDEITFFLKKVACNENLKINDDAIDLIQNMYESDIRSMINYMQSNQNMIHEFKIINNIEWNNLTKSLKSNNLNENLKLVSKISKEFCIEKKNLIKDYLNYLIHNEKNIVNTNFLQFVENLLHNSELNTDYFVKYAILQLSSCLKE
tara:strand:+ start:3322 stop:4251 length:930 start_codon:yes stop_codon:yes gene_type:complete